MAVITEPTDTKPKLPLIFMPIILFGGILLVANYIAKEFKKLKS